MCRCLAQKYIKVSVFSIHPHVAKQKVPLFERLCHAASLIILLFCAVWPSKHSQSLPPDPFQSHEKKRPHVSV